MVRLRIEELLRQKGKTKYWLIKEMNSDYRALNPVITNQTTSIHFETIERLCVALECTPGDLFEWDGDAADADAGKGS